MSNKVLLLATVSLLIGVATAQNNSTNASNSSTSQTSQSAAIPDPQVPAFTPPTNTQLQQIQELHDIHFDFNRAELRAEDRPTLQADADWLKAHPDVLVAIEGDADERGDIVYNVALSDRRAEATRDALVQMGVPSERVTFATGWGKLYPVCAQPDESCWSQNRRAHFEWWSEQATSAHLSGAPTGR